MTGLTYMASESREAKAVQDNEAIVAAVPTAKKDVSPTASTSNLVAVAFGYAANEGWCRRMRTMATIEGQATRLDKILAWCMASPPAQIKQGI